MSSYRILINLPSVDSVMGPVVSTPWVVGTPEGVYNDRMFWMYFYFQNDPVAAAATRWFNISSRPDAAKSTAQTATLIGASTSSSSSVSSPAGSSSSLAASKFTPGVYKAGGWERPYELDAGPRLYELAGS